MRFLPKAALLSLLIAGFTGLLFFILHYRISRSPDLDTTPSPTPNQIPNNVLKAADQLLYQGNEQHKNFQYEEAINFFQQALELYREADNREGEAMTLGRIGSVHHDQGNYEEAIKQHGERLKIAKEIGKRQEEEAAKASLGSAYYLMGNYLTARNYYGESWKIAEEIGDRRGEAIALGGLGSVDHALGDYETAIKRHEKRLEIAEEIGDRREKGAALGSLGNAYHARRVYGVEKDQGDYDKAIEYHEQRLEIAQNVGDLRGEAIALGSLGSVYYDMRDYNKAIEYHEKRRKLAEEKLKDPRLKGSAYGELGSSYYSNKEYSKAIIYVEEYRKISKQIKDKSGEGNALNNLGVFYFAAGEIAKAEEHLWQSIEVRESLIGGLPDTEKVFFFDTQQNAYVNLQKVLIHQKKNEQALEVAERGRARAFAELLARRQKENNETTTHIKIEDIKRIAEKQNVTLVEYSLVEKSGIDDRKQLLVWIVTPKGKVAFRQVDLTAWKNKWSASNSFLNKKLQDDRGNVQLIYVVRNAIGVEGRDSKAVEVSPEAQKKVFQAFYELLIKPIAADLNSLKEDDKIIFMPQGALWMIPFPALQDSSGKYLIDKHTFLTAPSIRILGQLLDTQSTKPPLDFKFSQKEDWLIVGNPLVPKLACSEESRLPELPGAQWEATEIAKVFKTEAMIGGRATELAVTDLMPRARIIHLATHGLLDNCKGLTVPGAIALTPSGNNEVDEARDGWLTANEISKLQLQAELVVLSACDTGRGRLTGDGVIGLSRSFMGAGVPSVIVSLWNVNDNSTAVLMTQFYQHLKYQSKQGNLDKAQALRQAMLKTKGQYSDPFDWSSFTLIGLP